MCIDNNKDYIVSGSELIRLQQTLDKIYTDIKWFRQSLTDSLNEIHDNEDIPRFVSRMGLLLGETYTLVNKFRDNDLYKSGMNLKLEEISKADPVKECEEDCKP